MRCLLTVACVADRHGECWRSRLLTCMQEVGVLTGHTDRLGKVAWHPGGRLIATASFDGTWRLWDAATRTCLTEQEGHSRSVYAVAFQGDGALAASGGLDAIGTPLSPLLFLHGLRLCASAWSSAHVKA